MVAGLTSGLAASASGSCPSYSRDSLLCGPKCLLEICNRLQVPADEAELAALSSLDQKKGTTLIGLWHAAKAKGLAATAVKIGLDELLRCKAHAIAHQWDNHFVLVEPGNAPDSVRVTEPPEAPQVVQRACFASGYSGFALLVARDSALLPVLETSGPDLRCDGYETDFGTVWEGDIPVQVLGLGNAGDQAIRIDAVESTCAGCTDGIGWPRTILPGTRGELVIPVVTAGMRGSFSARLFIRSNDPVSPIVPVDVRGYVRPKVLAVSPRRVVLRGRATREARAVLYVPSTERESVRVTSVSCDSPFVVPTLAESADPHRPGYTVRVALKPGTPPGALAAKIAIHSDHGKEPMAEVPLVAEVEGDVAIDRRGFFFGIVESGRTPASQVRIINRGDAPLAITGVGYPLKHVSLGISTQVPGKDFVLTARLNDDAPPGLLREDVIIRTNHPAQPEIRIPSMALVEKRAK